MDFPAWIDAELVERCKKSWEVADYESAVFIAFKVLETRAASISGGSKGLHGVKIIDNLLAPGSGGLRVSSIKSEQEGIHQTFRGLYLWLRNPSGHRFMHFGDVQAFELLCFVDFLLSFLHETHGMEIPVDVVDSPVGQYFLADVDCDGIQEKVILTERKLNGRTQSQLLVLDPDGPNLRKHVLQEVSAIFKGASLEVRDLNRDGIPEMVLSAPVGAHSESMYIFRWDGSTYQCVGEFLSTAPSIELKDLDGDGLAEIIVKGRDYRGDPITESVFEVYHWINGRYELVQATWADLIR